MTRASQRPGAAIASFGGRGKDYWIAAIETLEKEVR